MRLTTKGNNVTDLEKKINEIPNFQEYKKIGENFKKEYIDFLGSSDFTRADNFPFISEIIQGTGSRERNDNEFAILGIMICILHNTIENGKSNEENTIMQSILGIGYKTQLDIVGGRNGVSTETGRDRGLGRKFQEICTIIGTNQNIIAFAKEIEKMCTQYILPHICIPYQSKNDKGESHEGDRISNNLHTRFTEERKPKYNNLPSILYNRIKELFATQAIHEYATTKNPTIIIGDQKYIYEKTLLSTVGGDFKGTDAYMIFSYKTSKGVKKSIAVRVDYKTTMGKNDKAFSDMDEKYGDENDGSEHYICPNIANEYSINNGVMKGYCVIIIPPGLLKSFILDPITFPKTKLTGLQIKTSVELANL